MYIIKYNGIFEYGSVRFYLFFKPKKHNTTKFRFKWMAKFWCNILNASDSDFKTYYVSELAKEQENAPEATEQPKKVLKVSKFEQRLNEMAEMKNKQAK